MMGVKVFDAEGTERDWQWAVDRYGVDIVEAIPPEGATVFRLTEVRQKVGPCGMTVKVVDEAGNPLEDIAVLQGWVDGEDLPDDAAPRITLYWWKQPENKPNNGSGGFTNADGVFGWGWGPGEQYDPATQEGAHWYWIMPGEHGWFTDVILGLGWLFGSDHDTLTLTFTREVGEDPEPEPEDGDLKRLADAAERIAEILGQVFRVG